MATKTMKSGLYGSPAFYQIGSKQKLKNVDLLEIDMEVFEQHYDADIVAGEDHYDVFREIFDYHPNFYKPMVFNAEIAYKCGLLPFSYDGEDLLSLTGGGMDLNPSLDAYQVLTVGSIDLQSKYFCDRSYFKCVVGGKILKEIDAILMDVEDETLV